MRFWNKVSYMVKTLILDNYDMSFCSVIKILINFGFQTAATTLS